MVCREYFRIIFNVKKGTLYLIKYGIFPVQVIWFLAPAQTSLINIFYVCKLKPELVRKVVLNCQACQPNINSLTLKKASSVTLTLLNWGLLISKWIDTSFTVRNSLLTELSKSCTFGHKNTKTQNRERTKKFLSNLRITYMKGYSLVSYKSNCKC